MQNILINLIKIYRYTFKLYNYSCCRFYPTCSIYAIESIQVHGSLYGLKLVIFRLLKCHPFHKGGFDPVPVYNKHIKKKKYE